MSEAKEDQKEQENPHKPSLLPTCMPAHADAISARGIHAGRGIHNVCVTFSQRGNLLIPSKGSVL